MKARIFTLEALLMIVVLAMCCVSCGDDDEKDSPTQNSIVGVWNTTANYVDGSRQYASYSFSADGTFFAKWWDDFSDESDFGYLSGTYIYSSELNVLTMECVDEEGDELSFYYNCVISGNTMTWSDDDIVGGKLVLTRK